MCTYRKCEAIQRGEGTRSTCHPHHSNTPQFLEGTDHTVISFIQNSFHIANRINLFQNIVISFELHYL